MLEKTVHLSDGRTLLVRPIGAGDGPRLQAFNEALSEKTRGLFLPHGYDEATLARVISRAEADEDRAYLALAGDTVAGYFFLWEFREPVPVLGIGIADDFQGKGLGATFMEILIDDAKAAGRAGIELTTVPGNARAFALYEKMGFSHIRDADNIAGDGRVVREHVMFLPLQDGVRPPERDFKPPF